MPIPTVPLVIGGVVLAIGSGAAFKKWVYDPHLGPTLEALAIQFLNGRGRHFEAIPMAVGEIGRATPREERERPWARSSAYELHLSSNSGTTIRKRSHVQPSVDQVLFDAPSSPRQRQPSPRPRSRSITPIDLMTDETNSTPLASPRVMASQPMIQSPPQSTTYSFLSLSQTSSPAAPHAQLESLDAWATQGLGLHPASPDPMVASLGNTDFSAPSSVSGESWTLDESESDDDWERASRA
jgi:hypothetical protein